MNPQQLFQDFLAHTQPRPIPWDVYSELLEMATKKHAADPQLYTVEAENVLVVGDTHGDVFSSLSAVRKEWDAIVFLGDYVDRGPYQLENLAFLLSLELSHPDRVFLVRGNHESPLMNKRYGFLEVVASRYGLRAYREFQKLFANMSYAALINNTYLAVHGGIARSLKSVQEIISLPKNDSEPVHQTAFEILWNDPDENIDYFEPNPWRGEGVYLYGRKAVEDFLSNNNLKSLIRAHQPYPGGFKEHFGGKTVTVFSCRFYPIERPAALMISGDKGYKPVPLE